MMLGKILKILLFGLTLVKSDGGFFDYPDVIHKPKLAEFNHDEYMNGYYGKGSFGKRFDVKTEGNFQVNNLDISNQQNGSIYKLSTSSENIGFQNFLNRIGHGTPTINELVPCLNANNMKFKSGEINPDEGKFKMVASQENIAFAVKLVVTNAEFIFEWETSMRDGLKITIKGDVSVNDQNFPMTAVKNKNDNYFAILSYTGSFSGSIIGHMNGFDHTIDKTSIANVHDGVDFDKMESIQWTTTTEGTGHINIDGSFQLILYTPKGEQVNNIGAFGGEGGDLRMVLTRKSQQSSISLVAIFGDGTDPGPVIDGFLDKNPDDAFLQRFRNKRFGVIISQSEIVVKNYPAIKDKLKEIFDTAFPTEISDDKDMTLKGGVSVNVELDVREDLTRCFANLELPNPLTPDAYPKLTLSGYFTATGIQFSYPESEKLPMKEFLMCAVQNKNFNDLPPTIFDADNRNSFYVYDYFKSTTVTTITLRFKPPEPIHIRRYRILVKTIDVSLTVEKKEEKKDEDKTSDSSNTSQGSRSKPTPKAKSNRKQNKNSRSRRATESDGGNESGNKQTSDQQSSGKTMKTEYTLGITAIVEGDSDGETKTCLCSAGIPFEGFECTIYTASVTIEHVLRQTFPQDSTFVNEMLADESLQDFYNSGIKDLTINFNTGKTTKLSVLGTLVFGSYKDLHFEFVHYSGAGWAIGVAVNNIPLEEIINFFLKIFDVEISIPWLDKLNGAFIYNNVDMDIVKQMEFDGDGGRSSRSGNSGSSSSNNNKKKKKPKHAFRHMSHRKSKSFKLNKIKGNNSIDGSIDEMENRLYENIDSSSQENKRSVNHGGYKLTTRQHSPGSSTGGSRPSSSTTSSSGSSDQQSGNGQSSGDQANDENDEKKLFSLSLLRGFDVEEGITMSLEWFVPTSEEDCKGNSICLLLADKLPNTRMECTVVFNKATKTFKLIAGIDTDILMTETLKFTGARLEVSWGNSLDLKYIKIAANLRYIGDATLNFEGSIKATASGKIELSFDMFDMIPEPFGIRNLAIGRIHLGISLDIKSLSFKLEFGARIDVGKVKPLQRNAAITFEGYCGIDPANLAQSWVYAKASAMTLDILCRMFDVPEDKIPKFFEGQGWHNGLLFTYSPSGAKELEFLGKFIPQGIQIAGGITLLWFKAAAEVTMDFTNKNFEVKVDMSPIVWLDGLIKVVRADDDTKGPFMHIKLEAGEPVLININGEIRIFTMMYAVNILINDQQIRIAFEGTIVPGVLTGNVEAHVQLGSLPYIFRTFTVTIGVKLDDFARKLMKYMRDFLEQMKAVAEAMKQAAADINAAANQLNATVMGKINSWRDSVSSWRTRLVERQRELENERTSKQDYEDCVADCTDICIGFLDWNPQCWKVWGHFVGCPKWDPCKWEAPNIFCLAGCELEFLKTAFMEWLNETINKIAIAISNVADFFLDFFGKLTNAVAGMVKLAGDLVSALGDATMAFINFAQELLTFDLKKFNLIVTMGPLFHYCFQMELEMIVPFFTDPVIVTRDQAQICLNQLLWSLLKLVFGKEEGTPLKKVQEFDEKRSEFDGQANAAKKEQDNVRKEDEKTDRDVNSEMQKVDVEDATRRDMLPTHKTFKFIDETRAKYNHTYTKEERDLLHKPHEMNTNYKIPKHMLNAFNKRSAWVLAENHLDNDPRDYKPIQHMPDERFRRNIQLDHEEFGACDRMKRTLESYTDISNGLMKSITNMEYGKQQMNREKREHAQRLYDLHEHTHKLGSKYKNYTPKQKRQIYFWYENIKKGVEQHHRLNKRSVLQHDQDAIGTYTSHLNTIISKNKNTTFHDHIDHMHEDAMTGYRKSNIGKPDNGEEKLFHEIRKDIKTVLTRKDLPLSRMKRHLRKVNKNIQRMNEHVKRCQLTTNE